VEREELVDDVPERQRRVQQHVVQQPRVERPQIRMHVGASELRGEVGDALAHGGMSR
jgi:hypothetical protein